MNIELVDLRPPVGVRRATPAGSIEMFDFIRGEKGDAGDANATYAAGAVLSGHRIVRVLADGRVDYADAAVAAHRFSIAGLSLNAAVVNGDVVVARSGVVTLTGWGLTSGAFLFLGANGVLTQATPVAPASAFLQRVGYALSADAAFIDFLPPILLSGA